MISYIANYNSKSKCCKILESLESIKQYVEDRFSKQNTTISVSAVSNIPLKLKEPYNTYIARHGAPGNAGFNPELLGDIAMELHL